MFYPVKTPWIIKKLFPSLQWDVNSSDNVLYLTFDDGPHAVATPFVLDELKKYDAKATFFCIGKNVVAQPGIYKRIILEGHRTANHTYSHLNGWKVSNQKYFDDIIEAAQYIDSNLFRPPYGRMTPFQVKLLLNYKLSTAPAKIIMWDILSGDFDPGISPQQCAGRVIKKARPGSIIVFHDSEKAFERLKYALPRVLSYFYEKGYRFSSL
jgi:peptidoglycan/xylan/chitin deacetylase (PgdA/CDA1 family)